MPYSLFLYDIPIETLLYANHGFRKLFAEVPDLPCIPAENGALRRFLADIENAVNAPGQERTAECAVNVGEIPIRFECTRIERDGGAALLLGTSKERDGEKMLRLLADNLPDMLWAKDTEGRYLFANRAICDNLLMAKNTAEPLGKSDVFFARRERDAHKENPRWHTFGELCFDSDKVTLEHLKPMRFEEYGNVRGKLLYLEVHKAPFYDAHGDLIGTVGSGRDITLQKQLETELSKANENMKALLDSSIEARFIFDRDGVCIETNAVASEMTGYAREEIIGMYLHDFIPDETKSRLNRPDDRDADAPYETELLQKSGTSIPVLARGKEMELFSRPVRVSAMINLSEIKQANRRIEYLAFHDTLTGLPNRTLFMEQLKEVMALSERRDKRYCALMFIDLDDFKNINDTQGHEAGDRLLKNIAERLLSTIGQGDIVTRFGGDEFVVLLSDIDADQAEAARITEKNAETVRRQIADIHFYDRYEHNPLHSSCSIGVTVFRDREVTPSDLLRQADIALYEAKKAGKNAIRFFNDEMQETVNRQIVLHNEIDQALRQDAFELYYQPQVDAGGVCIGAEALCRWNHPKSGVLPPSKFIPFSEKSGQIHPLGYMILSKACETLRRWQEMPGFEQLTLSVNISAEQFHHPDFLDKVIDLLSLHRIVPHTLKLELTESIFMSNIQNVIKMLERLHARGVIISLDDFGTGFSSLSYLKKLPLHQLKIDQGFVRDILTDGNDQAIVSATIALADMLNFDIIAEGVESEAQQALLTQMGCGYFQGYLFGEPMQRDQFETRIASGVCRKERPAANEP